MKKIKTVLQQGTSDCGCACIATILQYYGKSVALRKISEIAGTDRNGTSGVGIIKAMEYYGFSSTGILVNDKNKISSMPFPFIVQFKCENYEHYVVPYGVKKGFVYYCDPAKGDTKCSIEEFNNKWSGIAFLIHPTSRFEKGKESKGVFSRFFILLKPYKKYLIETFIASFFLSCFGIMMALYFRFLIDEVLYTQIEATLNLCSVCYLIVVLMQVILNLCRNQILNFLGAKIDVCLISDFYLHLLKLPLDFFTKRKTGEILSRINDANVIRNAISTTLLSIVMDSLMVLLGGFFMLKMGSVLLPISIIPVVISSLVVFLLKKPFKTKINIQSIYEAEKNASMYEMINGISTIKGLATENKAFMRIESKIVEAEYKKLDLTRLANIQNALQTFISSCGTLSIYWIGSSMIFKNQITLGQLICFTTLSGYFLGPLSHLLTMQSYWQEVYVSAERLSTILDLKEEDDLQTKLIDIDCIKGDIEFKDVCFSYGTRGRAINGVSFKIPEGKKVAFVGLSGSGKSTLIKLLMKFYKIDEGQIKINNKDIYNYSNDSYRSRFGYVPQQSLLFSGTIRENICWGSVGVTNQQIEDAADAAQISDFINLLPDKYDTVVGEQGATLSGGERQRIALARILLRNPDVIILDEATASLDSISEKKIMDTIYRNIRNRTVIMVAHRLSTICNCDCIFVFEHGQLVEKGNHETLLSMDGKYSKMWKAQNEKNNSTETSE